MEFLAWKTNKAFETYEILKSYKTDNINKLMDYGI